MEDDRELHIPFPRSSLDAHSEHIDKVMIEIMTSPKDGGTRTVTYNFVPGNLIMEDLEMLPETAWAI